MAHLKTNEIELYYHEKGNGEPLILIPGFAQYSRMWDGHIGPLSHIFHTVALDNRGSGQSSTPEGPYAVEDFARDIIALMDELKIDSAHLLGNSMGTAIALQLCSDYPERVKRVVLCAPFPKLTTLALYRTEVLTRALELGIDHRLFIEFPLPWLFSNQFFEDEKNIEQVMLFFLEDPYPQSLAAWKAQLAALSAFDIGERAHKIPHEILLLAGENDLLTPVDGAEWLCDQILNAQLTILKGQGHTLANEKQDEVISLAQKFLTGQ